MTNNTFQYRPWTPIQILVMSFLFGVAAGGAVTGINFKSMGKPKYMWPSMIIGLFLFLLVLYLILYIVPEESGKSMGILINVVIGIGFMLAQRSHFNEWKTSNWVPQAEGERYKPNRIGLLIMVGLVCLVIEVGIVFIMSLGMAGSGSGPDYYAQQRKSISYGKDQRLFRLSSQVVSDDILNESSKTSVFIGQHLLNDIPDVQDYLCFMEWNYLRFGDEFYFAKTYYANSSIFINASVDLVMGNPAEALNEPNSAVISETMAMKLFGQANPIDNTININGHGCIVTGVFMDLPKKSMIKSEVLVSYPTLTQQYESIPLISDIYTDIILIEGHSFTDISDEISFKVDLQNESGDTVKLMLEIIANPIPVLNPEVSLVLPDKKIRYLGFEAEGVMVYPLPAILDPVTLWDFKAELMNHPGILAVSESSNPLIHGLDDMLVNVNQTNLMTNVLTVGYTFIELMQLQLVEGRNFDPDYPEDDQMVLVNESFFKHAGWENHFDETVVLNILEELGIYQQEKIVIGVVKEFYLPSGESYNIEPLIITLEDASPAYLFVKTHDGKEHALEFIEKNWEHFFPGYPCRPIDLESMLGR